MNQKQYHSLEELPLMMNMTDVAAVLGISRAGAYKLAHSADFPAFQIGRRIVVSRENFLGRNGLLWMKYRTATGHSWNFWKH
mgnify:CR=1 FL=1